jgi:RsiW-degrading membrane proteinase PrsW (M82 family)
MITVLLAIPAETFIAEWIYNITHVVISAAAIEEILKFSIIFLIAFSPKFIDEPTDYALFLITGGLGFAALENTLFLLEPITNKDVAVSLLTGNLRFLGATVLHTVASASAGIALGLAFYQSKLSKIIHGFFGLCTAITLHALFNYLILQSTVQNTVIMFATLWVSAVLLLLMFEKLKNLQPIHKQHKTPHI